MGKGENLSRVAPVTLMEAAGPSVEDFNEGLNLLKLNAEMLKLGSKPESQEKAKGGKLIEMSLSDEERQQINKEMVIIVDNLAGVAVHVLADAKALDVAKKEGWTIEAVPGKKPGYVIKGKDENGKSIRLELEIDTDNHKIFARKNDGQRYELTSEGLVASLKANLNQFLDSAIRDERWVPAVAKDVAEVANAALQGEVDRAKEGDDFKGMVKPGSVKILSGEPATTPTPVPPARGEGVVRQ